MTESIKKKNPLTQRDRETERVMRERKDGRPEFDEEDERRDGNRYLGLWQRRR
jgi:hypothetical protein